MPPGPRETDSPPSLRRLSAPAEILAHQVGAALRFRQGHNQPIPVRHARTVRQCHARRIKPKWKSPGPVSRTVPPSTTKRAVCGGALVRGRLLYVIDDQRFDGIFGRFQLQSELFLQSGKERRTCCIRGGAGSTGEAGQIVNRPFQMYIEYSG